MKLLLIREAYTEGYTLGKLYINGEFECHTLEDEIRNVKIYGETAIPCGTYDIIVTMSNRFKKELPILLDVSNFSGIRIHSGNTAADTSGCILVGKDPRPNWVGDSRRTFKALMLKIRSGLSRIIGVSITIIDKATESYEQIEPVDTTHVPGFKDPEIMTDI